MADRINTQTEEELMQWLIGLTPNKEDFMQWLIGLTPKQRRRVV